MTFNWRIGAEVAIKKGRAGNHDARLTMRSALWDVPVKCSGVWKGQCLQGWIFGGSRICSQCFQ